MTDTAPMLSGYVWRGGRMIPYRIDDRRRACVRPSILVVIPYYNAAAWIDECLATLAANDEPHDILIVDDGSEQPVSTNESYDNLVMCRFEHNTGVVTARNFAASFALSQGYLYHVCQDADDLCSPERLRRQREAIERDGADLVVSGVTAVDERGNVIWSKQITEDQDVFYKALATRNPAVQSTYFMRTDLFARIGCYDERFNGAEDFDLLQRIARRGKISIVPDQLVRYLVRSGSLSASREPALHTIRIMAQYFDPSRPASYFGLVRATGAMIASRQLKTAARKLLSGRKR